MIPEPQNHTVSEWIDLALEALDEGEEEQALRHLSQGRVRAMDDSKEELADSIDDARLRLAYEGPDSGREYVESVREEAEDLR